MLEAPPKTLNADVETGAFSLAAVRLELVSEEAPKPGPGGLLAVPKPVRLIPAAGYD